MKRIEITNMNTGRVDTYQLSSKNWRNAPAAMREGLVIEWIPPHHIPTDGYMVTAGRKYRLIAS